MTRAERFKVEQQRAAHANHPPHTSHESAGKRARARGRRKDRIPNQASHNESARVARNSTYEHEVSATTRPSRKSSRKSPRHIKSDGPLRMKTLDRNATPKIRWTRPTGNPN